MEVLFELGLELREFVCQHLLFLVEIDALNLLCHEDKLVGVGLFFDATEQRILQKADREHLLLVASLYAVFLGLGEGVTYNRNEQVEEHDKIEEDAEDEDDPVEESVERQVFSELSD